MAKDTIIGLIAIIIPLLKVNPDLQTRKNLRLARKSYRRLHRIMKKGGIDAHEQRMLDKLVEVQWQATIDLIK